eukprot:comp18973_c3_seq1/m.21276 comp18973_c3_seq1/g.21276  ORF comp18973_c3_seq1/g.21276 comp18973_c3_seq1/m.21276 type:complete len:335 (-) comp18973_c3_seq1:146-1150(-)
MAAIPSPIEITVEAGIEPWIGMSLKDALEIIKVEPRLARVLVALADATADIAAIVRVGTVGKLSSQNSFGDVQLEMDVRSDKAVFDRLRETDYVAYACSEETPDEQVLGGEGYSVAFDPLDGSSVVDANFSFGSIFGVWPGKTFQGQRGRDQVASAISVYGPRTTMVFAIPGTKGSAPQCFEVTYQWNGKWKVTRSRIVVEEGKIFAFGNMRAVNDIPSYRHLFDYYLENRYTQRYTGALVPDIYHILMKGKGVLTNVASDKSPAKLRVMYETCPIALVMECAGGATSDGRLHRESILDITIEGTVQYQSVCMGSKQEVARFNEFGVSPTGSLD